MKHITFMAFFIFFFNSVSLAQGESNPDVFVICKLGSHVRTIAIHKKGEIFETIYSKFGQPRSVGSGRSLESNKGFLSNVRTNLEKSGWDCREVSDASVVSTSEES